MTEQKVSIGLSLHKRTKAIEMLQWFADILIALKSSWPSRSSFSWSIVFVQHVVDSSDLLTSNRHDNNTCFLVLPISIFSLLRTRPSATWGKIYSIIYLLPREEAWLHRNLYHNSIKGTVILLKIFLFVQLSIPAALRLWLSLPPVFAGSSNKKRKKRKSLHSTRTYQLNHNKLLSHGHDRAESLHWTLAAQTNKDYWDDTIIRW